MFSSHFARPCFLASLLALAALAPTPALAAPEPTQAVTDFFPAEPRWRVFLAPFVEESRAPCRSCHATGLRLSDEARGTVALRLAVTDEYGVAKPFENGVVVYTLDGSPISPPLAGTDSFQWDTTATPDGTHVLGLVVVDGPADLTSYRVAPTQVVVDNDPGPLLGPQRLPVLGSAVDQRRFVSPTADWIHVMGTYMRPHATPHPLAYRFAPPANQLANPADALDYKNWALESLTESASALYQGKPVIYRNSNGHLVTSTLYQQSQNDSAKAVGSVLRRGNHDGPRNDNSVSPFSSYVPDPEGPGWVGVDLAGRIFRVAQSGEVRTIAGEVVDENTVPYWPEIAVSASARDSTRKIIGSFEGGLRLNAPTDLAFDPRNPKVLYVADYLNHRIVKVDLSASPPRFSTYAGRPGQPGYDDGASRDATFNRPSSIAAAPDGTLYVADQENRAIRRIAADGSSVGTLAASSIKLPFAPFAVRLDSSGDLIVTEFNTGLIRKVLAASGSIRAVASIPECATPWMWLDVDRHGNVGPRDDILVACASGGSSQVFRLAKDGSRRVQWPRGLGDLNQGRLAFAHEPGGHYPWVVAIDDEESRIIYQGMGNLGLRQIRLARPEDPRFPFYQSKTYALLQRAEEIMTRGTVANFPFGSRPSFTALLGITGHGHLGVVKNFDDLADLDDDALAAYIQSGMGGEVPRPEITGRDLDALMYYIRVSSLRGTREDIPIPPGRSDVTPAVVSNVAVRPVAPDQVEVTWETNEPSIGLVVFGTSREYHRWSDIEEELGRSHRALLTLLPQNKSLHFAILTRDEAGNQTMTADREYTGGHVYAPTATLRVEPTAVQYGDSVRLHWSSTGSTTCIASGGWLGTKAVSGEQSRGPLTASTVFALTCKGPGGSATSSVPVSVAPRPTPPTLSFTASAATVAPGGSATLTWDSTGATSCTALNGWSGAKPVDGSATTAPVTATTVYSLACTGKGGGVTKSVLVRVGSAGSGSPAGVPGPAPAPAP